MRSAGQILAQDRPKILAKSERWLVVDKPAGWLTIPGRAEGVPVLSEWAEREQGKVWVVHRLDRETSGVALFARSAEAHRQAGLWFQKHEVRKTYDLIAQGTPRAPMLRLKEPVGGAPSVTQLEVVERFESCFLGRAQPLTGRRHQIRIHLSGEGHPLLGDPTYGGSRELGLPGGERLAVGRVALHAARLELPTREVFTAKWPEDFGGWVQSLRGGARA